MTRLSNGEQEELHRRLAPAMEQLVSNVMATVNAARDGHLINDSEVAANDLLNDFKQLAYQTALQVRVDATEASFSPGGPCGGGSGQQQGSRFGVACDAAGAGGDQPAAV